MSFSVVHVVFTAGEIMNRAKHTDVGDIITNRHLSKLYSKSKVQFRYY